MNPTHINSTRKQIPRMVQKPIMKRLPLTSDVAGGCTEIGRLGVFVVVQLKLMISIGILVIIVYAVAQHS